jgi:neutral ceramidase
MAMGLLSLGATLVLAGAGCNRFGVALERPAPLPASGRLRVGAARADITPVPGLPMSGYGFIGKVARGFWTHLYANALVVEDAAGTPLVLVSCDLLSISAGLADAVVARVQADPRGRGIGREHVVLAATHAHQGPGAFSSDVAYNLLFAPQPGYDPALFDFLAARISDAILRAAAARAPATMAWRDGHLPGFARNRSFAAFVRNPRRETEDFLGPAAGLPLCDLRAPVASREACRAVDPTVTVVRFERDGRLVGAAVFTAVHPTAMGPALAVYSSDLFGVAGIEAARRLRPRAGRREPVLAFFNGAEGDVSPNWRSQDGPNTRALGHRLAEAVVALAAGGERVATPAIGHAFERVRIAGACAPDGDGRQRCAAPRPLVGRATLAGASDGRTHLLPWLFRDGVTRAPWGPQGVKVPALDPGLGWVRLPLTALLLLPVRDPATAPLGVYTLGPLALATLPGEFTTMMGRRIATTVAAALPAAERILLVGLANTYMSYFTTPEEYALQRYEGSSTLFGPQSGPVVAAALGRLAAHVAAGDGSAPAGAATARETHTYTPGPSRAFGPANIAPAATADDGLRRLLREPPYEDTGPPYPGICWRGAAPTFPDVRLPRVVVEIEGDAGAWEALPDATGYPEDNTGADVVTVMKGRSDGGADWRAVWMPPAGVDPAARLRLRVERVGAEPVAGEPFTLDTPRPVSFCDATRG